MLALFWSDDDRSHTNVSLIVLDRNVNDPGQFSKDYMESSEHNGAYISQSPPIWFLASQTYFILSFLDMPIYPIISQI